MARQNGDDQELDAGGIHWSLLATFVLALLAVIGIALVYVSSRGTLEGLSARLADTQRISQQQQKLVDGLRDDLNALVSNAASPKTENRYISIADTPTLLSLISATRDSASLEERVRFGYTESGNPVLELRSATTGEWVPALWLQLTKEPRGSGSEGVHFGYEVLYNVPVIDNYAFFNEFRAKGTPGEPEPENLETSGWIFYRTDTNEMGIGVENSFDHPNSLIFLTTDLEPPSYMNTAEKRMEIKGQGSVGTVSVVNADFEIHQSTDNASDLRIYDKNENLGLHIGLYGGGTPLIGTDNGANLFVLPQGFLDLSSPKNVQVNSLVLGSQTVTLDADGSDDPVRSTVTPGRPLVSVVCNDTNGCEVSLDAAGAVTGQVVTVVNASLNVLTIASVPDVVETSGPFVGGPYSTMSLVYAIDRWVETSRSLK